MHPSKVGCALAAVDPVVEGLFGLEVVSGAFVVVVRGRVVLFPVGHIVTVLTLFDVTVIVMVVVEELWTVLLSPT